MKKKLFSILFCICYCLTCLSQTSQQSENGCCISPTGTFRIYFVFVDVDDDPYNKPIPGWEVNQLPRYKDSIIDFSVASNMQFGISKFYQQASFGSLNVVGDYCRKMLHLSQVNINNEDEYSYYIDTVIKYMNRWPADSIITFHGLQLSNFDNWSFSSQYTQHNNCSDNYLDMFAIVWRRNSKFRDNRDGGQSHYYSRNIPLHNLSGVNYWMNIYTDNVAGCMRHEFAHDLLGGNSYHTGGAGAGVGNFLSNIGGYSILSSFNRNLYSCNGWDRWRLGWKNPDNQYDISARSATDGSEVEADLVYGETLTESEFVLRYFIKYGDAIRIKLPYLQTLRPNAKNQYLWIENHQLLPGSIEEDDSKPKGIRFNIQIGNDQQDVFASRTNYFVPLSSFGNYDFDYFCNPANVPFLEPRRSYYTAATQTQSANPFTGYHLSMSPAIDTTPTDNVIGSKEYVDVWNVLYNGEEILTGHPVFGSPYDAFYVGQSLRLASNPPSTPLITYNSRFYINRDIQNPANPGSDDNRHIFLNGLRIDIVEQYPEDEGSIKVRIRWDDFDVDRDVRWCDSIILTEQVILKTGHTITLDQGLTPVQPNNPMTFNNKSIFADPTVFTCMDGSLFKQEPLTTVNVINNSTLEVESGATYEVGDNAVLNIGEGATLHLKQGSTLRVKGRGHIEINTRGYICIEDGANIILENTLSVVNLHDNCFFGTRYNSVQSNCTSVPLTQFPYAGNGSINVFSGNTYIQNRTFNQDIYFTGDTIRAGHHVTNQTPTGNVIILNDTDVILDGDDAIYLEAGVEVKKGGTLEAR